MDRIQKRFDELAVMELVISDSIKTETRNVRSNVQYVNNPTVYTSKNVTSINLAALAEWETSVLALLARVFGTDDDTYKQFEKTVCHPNVTGHFAFERLAPVFRSAKNQFEGGYIFDIRNLVHAEVFSTELEQAEHFLENSHEVAAAVTAGIVLETTIKKLCDRRAISLVDPRGKYVTTDTLISELRKTNLFIETVAKQLKAWMGVRNDAAHGKRGNGQFEDGELRRMIEGVGDFVAKHMS